MKSLIYPFTAEGTFPSHSQKVPYKKKPFPYMKSSIAEENLKDNSLDFSFQYFLCLSADLQKGWAEGCPKEKRGRGEGRISVLAFAL